MKPTLRLIGPKPKIEVDDDGARALGFMILFALLSTTFSLGFWLGLHL
jgi:hypothetical protein